MRGRGCGGQLSPPWLWLWLIGDLAVLIPAEIGSERFLFNLYSGRGDIPAQVTAGTSYKLLLLFTILAGLTYAAVAVGVVLTMFPQLRGGWVERRLASASDDAAGERVALAEMQQFVDQYDASIRLRAVAGDDRAAGIYPAGWRAARIAVFRPLFLLWQRDRPAAQALLLHEVALRRHGDQFVAGLGSPLIRLIRIWVPVFFLLALAPVVVYIALGSGQLAEAVSGRGGLLLLQPAELLILPVTALWLAELNADQLTARILGPEPLARSLKMTAEPPASLAERSLRLLSQPPRRLRLRCAAPRRAGRGPSPCLRPGPPP